MAKVSLEGVSKTYAGGHAAVRELDLQVADGELLVLVGPSGCGKSTLLRLVAGLETPTAGRVLVGDTDVTQVPPQHRDLAMVFQSYALYPHMTVRDNLAYGLRVRGTDRGTIGARIAVAAEALDLQDLLERRPAQLSGGQRQRVALGRAMVREPKAFLLDEPLSNLDPALRAQARAELVRLHRRLGATILYVTHDQEEAMTLGSRVAVMRDGVIEQVAPPLDMYARPANTFVARFIGAPAMNLLPPPLPGIDARAGILFGIRPADVRIDSDGPIRATVDLVEHRGHDAVVYLRAHDAARTAIVALIHGDTNVAAGVEVGLSLAADRVHRFDAATGRRIS